MRAVSPIHFIVENGNITLVGLVGSRKDREHVGIAAGKVPGVIKVTNELRIRKTNL